MAAMVLSASSTVANMYMEKFKMDPPPNQRVFGMSTTPSCSLKETVLLHTLTAWIPTIASQNLKLMANFHSLTLAFTSITTTAPTIYANRPILQIQPPLGT